VPQPPVLELRRKEIVGFKDCAGLAQQPGLNGVAYYRGFDLLIVGAIGEFGFDPNLGPALRLAIGGALAHESWRLHLAKWIHSIPSLPARVGQSLLLDLRKPETRHVLRPARSMMKCYFRGHRHREAAAVAMPAAIL
jgi:hypothetical protein